MPHILIENFSLSYNGTKTLKDISISIPDCQITALIGPSGCGKTTLLKSINRLHDINEEVKTEGRIVIDDRNIYDPLTDVLLLRSKIGFLSQKPFPLPMSIYENVAFGLRLHKTNILKERQEIIEFAETSQFCSLSGDNSGRIFKKYKPMNIAVEYYLKLAGLWEELKTRLNEPASKLSIGQQQRLTLARSLAVEPEVILADEPTSALDPVSTKMIESQFELLKPRYTIVLVTHILRQARRLADFIGFMYYGELIEQAAVETFFSAPQNEITKEYISGEIS